MGELQRFNLFINLENAKHKQIILFDEYLSAINENFAAIIHEKTLKFLHQNNILGLFVLHHDFLIKNCDYTIKLNELQKKKVINKI